MYGVLHPDLVQQRWMVFVAYIILCWLLAAVVLFANRITPYFEQFAAFVVIVGLIVTVIVCAVMPHVNGQPYASNAFVWSDWVNVTGYSSDGFAFLLGMLNGSFAVGTPDVTSHLAEEIPRYGNHPNTTNRMFADSMLDHRSISHAPCSLNT